MFVLLMFTNLVFCIIFFINSIIVVEVYAEETFNLSESNLLKALKDSPESNKILIDYLKSSVEYKTNIDRYTTSFNINYNKEKTEEQPIDGYKFPITKNTDFYSLGISKSFNLGVDLTFKYYVNKFSDTFVNNVGKSSVFGTVSIDLFKNFLGRISKLQLADKLQALEISGILKEINQKALEIKIRKLYWNYWAIKLSLELSNKLLVSAQKQLSIAKKRHKEDIADISDVSRLAANKLNRQSEIFNYNFQLVLIEKEIKSLIPNINNKKIKFVIYDFEEKVNDIKQCIYLINTFKSIPNIYSSLDELIAMKKKLFSYKQKYLESYADIDIKLNATLGKIGTGISNKNIRDNLFEKDDKFSSVELSFSMPLGKSKKDTEKEQLLLAKTQLLADVESLYLKLNSLHDSAKSAIGLLFDVSKGTTNASNHLEKVVKNTRKKYRQARINVYQLLQEEEKYYLNNLSEILIKRDIVLSLLDYFSVFTDLPCKFNNIK